jgi:hypothetical protein
LSQFLKNQHISEISCISIISKTKAYSIESLHKASLRPLAMKCNRPSIKELYTEAQHASLEAGTYC